MYCTLYFEIRPHWLLLYSCVCFMSLFTLMGSTEHSSPLEFDAVLLGKYVPYVLKHVAVDCLTSKIVAL